MLGARSVLVVLTAVALAVCGCGSGTKSSKETKGGRVESVGSSQSVSRAQLIAQADSICRRVNQRRSAIEIKTQHDYAVLIPPLAAFEKAAMIEMSTLTPPASLAGDWRAILRDTRTIANGTATIGKYAKANDFNKVKPLFRVTEKALLDMVAIAKRDGFTDCASHTYA